MTRSIGLTLFVILLVATFAFRTTTANAQEKTKINGKKVMVRVERKVFEPGDDENHSYYITKSKGYDVITGAVCSNIGVGDYIKKPGHHPSAITGYGKMEYPSKGTILTKWVLDLNVTRSPGGEITKTFKGDSTFIKGSGEFEGIKGSMTYGGKILSDGIYT